MKQQRLLLAGLILLLAHAGMSLSTAFKENSLQAGPASQGGSAEQTSADVCQTASPAVVTIYAGREFGSGSVVSSDGLVITNNHVIRDASDRRVWVKTIAGSRYRGTVTATDPVNDLALVRLSTSDSLPNVQLNTNRVETGQPVCAIGSPFNRAGVLARGTLTTVLSNGDLQSALRLFPGNSGGPLLNTSGEMIGVNKAIWQSSTGENSGISYATSVTVVKSFVEQNLAKSSTVENPMLESPIPSQPLDFSANLPEPLQPVPARLGVMLDRQTLEIQAVELNSPAELAGLRVGDRLRAIDGSSLQGFEQLQSFLNQRPGSAVFEISRNQQQESVRITF